MAGRVVGRRLAEEDLREAYLFLGTDSPAAAERLLEAVGEAVQVLLESPDAGRLRDLRSPRARDVRSWAVRGFQDYLVFYRCEGGDLEIVRLLHGARDLSRLLEEEP